MGRVWSRFQLCGGLMYPAVAVGTVSIDDHGIALGLDMVKERKQCRVMAACAL